MIKRLLLLFMLPALLIADEKHVITVLGKKVPFVFDGQRQVLVIEGETLRQIPALTLPELLAAAANLHLTRRGLFQADPQLQGLNQEQLLVLVNGLPVNNAQTGHHNLTMPFDISQIERIEISRSAYSSLSGPAGSAGAVNIVTGRTAVARIGCGSHGTTAAAVNLKFGDWGVAGGIETSDGYQRGLDGRKAHLSTSAFLPIGRSRLDFWAGIAATAFGARNFYAAYDSYEELDRLLAAAKWQCPIDSRTALEARFSGQFSHDRYTLVRDDPGLYQNLHRTWQQALETEIRRYGETYSLRLGAALWADRIRSSGIRGGVVAPALGDHVRSWSALLAEASRTVRGFLLNAGVRATLGDNRDLSGHLLLAAHIASGIEAEISLGHSFRIPTYTELYYCDPMHRSNPELKPERTWSASIGLRRQQVRHPFSARLFFNRASDLIDWAGDAERSMWLAQNIQKATFCGFDLQQDFSIGRASLALLYTFQKVRFTSDPTSKPLKYHFYFPDHSLSCRFVRELKNATFLFNLKAEREEASGTIRLFVNLRLGKTLGPLFVYFDLLNLLDERLQKIPGLPEPPRTAFVGILIRPR